MENKSIIVRIKSINLQNIKNTINGTVYMPSGKQKNQQFCKSEILGIYGQNGSGKTSIIDVLNVVKHLLMGDPLPKDIYSLIYLNSSTSTFSIEFDISVSSVIYNIIYTIGLRKDFSDMNQDLNCLTNDMTIPVSIINEKITYSIVKETGKSRKKVLLDFLNIDDFSTFSPASRFNLYEFNDKTELIVCQRVASEKKTSYIFNNKSLELLCKTFSEKDIHYYIILNALRTYAKDLIVIPATHAGEISANLAIPFTFNLQNDHGGAFGNIPINALEPTVIPKKYFEYIKRIVSAINTVIGNIISGLQLEIYKYGNQVLQNNEEGIRFEILTNRNGLKLALQYESEGIIKLVSMLNVLIYAYNNPSSCLAIDELDSGIYEYLLGEILDIFDKSGKGQLIFTSHNLRPLELLNKNSIMFSTSNPRKRYISLKGVKNNNNLRDLYIRCISLGGQEEELYKATNSSKISRSFRLAGKEILNDD